MTVLGNKGLCRLLGFLYFFSRSCRFFRLVFLVLAPVVHLSMFLRGPAPDSSSYNLDVVLILYLSKFSNSHCLHVGCFSSDVLVPCPRSFYFFRPPYL